MDNEEKRTQQKAVDMEWRRVTIVMDRLFFYLYIATIIGSLILLFPRRADWNYWLLISMVLYYCHVFGNDMRD